MTWEYNKTNFDRNLAVVIGINSYKNHPQIHSLRTPVNDAKALADLLETEYEYKPENVIRLLDEAATLTGLQTLLDDTLPNQLKPTKGDRLIFYFAGHGIPRNSEDGPKGYLVPQDADWQKEGSFLAMSEVYEALKKLDCHHLLVILDCCFAGTFRWAGRRKIIPILETVRREHYDRFIRYPAWQVITSAAHDQEALDVAKLAEDKRGAVADEKQVLHSPFALALLEGLRENKADLIPDGVITAHELYVYLEQQVSKWSGSRQKPGIYPMRLEYDRGEFVFTKPGFTSEQLKPAPLLNESNNPYRGLASFDEKHANFFFGRKILVEELQHRLSQPNRSLTVVLGVSGSGKSSLVKAGLIPELRQESKWYILDPIRPDRYPFTALARAILPIAQPELIEQLSQVSFFDEVFKPKEESGQDKGDESTNAVFVKLAEFWNSATPEAKLLVVEDYFKQLQDLCRNSQQEEQLSQLYRAIFEQLESLSNRLQNSRQHLTRVIRKWSETHLDVKLLLTIDQFEELITMSQESQTETHGGDRQQSDRPAESQPWLPFLQVLLEAIVECSQQLHIVLTLRSDFEPRFLSSPLSAYWKDARFPVRAMNLDELRQAIEGPALKQALYFEPPELVGKLIDEVGQMPGALPLLSFTLSELYIKLHDRWTKDNATDRALRIKDYEELGGVPGALTRRATEEYDNLVRDFGETSGKAYQATMRRVMLRMVTTEGGGVARRRVPESELVYPDSEENKRVAQVSDRLIKARLLVKGQETGEPYVEPAHDFLVRGWGMLQDWLDEQRKQETLELQQRLAAQASDWDRNNRPNGLLLPDGDRLSRLEQIIKSEDNWFNECEEGFVKKSIKQAKKIKVKPELLSKAERVKNILSTQPLESLMLAIQVMGENLDILPEDLLTPVLSTLKLVMDKARVSIPFVDLGNINSVAFSSDGETIVSGGDDKTVRLWNLQGKQIGEAFIGHEDSVNSVAFCPDRNRRIIASGGDTTVRLWGVKGKEIIKPLKHEEIVASVLFSPDGSKIASRTNNGKVYLWQIDGNFIRQLFEECEDTVTSFAFSPCGNRIVSADGRKVRLWGLNGEPIGEPFLHEKNVLCVLFNPKGTEIVSQTADNSVYLLNPDFDPVRSWNDARIKLIFSKADPDFKGAEKLLAISLDGIKVVCTNINELIFRKLHNGELIEKSCLHQGQITVAAFSPDSTKIVCGTKRKYDSILSEYDKNCYIELWDITDSCLRHPLGFNKQIDTVYSVAFNRSGTSLVSGCDDNQVCFWSIDGKLKQKTSRRHEQTIISVAFTPDENNIISASLNEVRLWDLDGNCLKELFLGQEQNNCKILVSDRSVVIFSGKLRSQDYYPNEIYLYDLEGNLIGKPFVKYESYITSIAISPCGTKIAAGNTDGIIHLCNLNGEPLADPCYCQQSVRSVTFSSDGNVIIGYDYSKTIYLWYFNEKRIQKFSHNEDYQEIVPSPVDPVISPDGKLILGQNTFSSLRLWDLAGNWLGEFQTSSPKDVIHSFAFSPNGQLIVAGSIGNIQLWRGHWQEWLRVCCDRLRYDPVFTNPESIQDLGERQIAIAACETCQKYVWNKEDTSV